MEVRVSLVIPTLNRKRFLENTLKDISNQNFPQFEVIIIDQSDNDFQYNFPDPLQGRITIIRLLEKSASRARNIGLINAKGEVVIFLDDDIIIDHQDFIFNHYRHYQIPSINGVAGAILNTEKIFSSYRHKWSLRKDTGWLFFPINYDSHTYIDSAWAGNFSIRRDFALQIGGMDENFTKGAFREEADFCIRYSQKFGPFYFDPAAYIIHIGAKSGGIRSFFVPIKVKAQQHYDGLFYFLFKNIPLRDYIFHLASAYIYFLHKKVKWYDFPSFFREIAKCLKGMINARKLLQNGPKYVSFKNQ